MWAIRGSLLLGMVCLWGADLIIDSPEQINQEWEKKFLGIKYGITSLDNTISEMVDGLIDDYFDKEFIGRISQTIKNQPKGEGEYKEYWPNGTLKALLPYKDGKGHGHLHGWYDNGVDAFKGYFTDGIKQGIHITFYRTEPKNNQIKARKLTFDEQGVLDGEVFCCHLLGNLLLNVPYLKGKASGKLTGWDQNRKCYLEVLYKDGVLQKGPVPNPGQGGELRPSPYLKYVNEVMREFEKIAYKEFGICGAGSGGQMPFDVVSIRAILDINKKGTVEESRELMVKLKQILREVINSHEKIRPYLRQYPIDLKNVDVSFSFHYLNRNKELDCKNVDYVFMGNENKIYYCYFDNSNKSKHLLVEPYEEAVKIVRAKDLKNGGIKGE
jgi:hypothetical protein